jgi:queuosine precursor transporter
VSGDLQAERGESASHVDLKNAIPASGYRGSDVESGAPHGGLNRPNLLFLVLCAFFVTNVILAEFIGVKIFSLGPALGLAPIPWRVFGIEGVLELTAGVMLWPVVFVLTDIINEYYGGKGVRFISWLTTGLIVYAFGFAYLAIRLAPAVWWPAAMVDQGVPDQQAAFAALFGQGMWAIGGSITAFLLGQIIDVRVFHAIRRRTGERRMWLRATGSTLISQCVDTFVVLYIMFVLGPQQWPLDRFFAIGSVNYAYKVVVALLMTPILYGVHALIERFLGRQTAAEMKTRAAD